MSNVTQLQPFYRGDDFALEVQLRQKESQTPIDITGWVLTSTMKLSSELPDNPQMNDTGQRQVLQVIKVVPDNDDARQGRATLLFPHEETEQLIPTTYQLDIQAEVSDSVTTLMKGKIQVLSDVTRDTFDVIPVFPEPAKIL